MHSDRDSAIQFPQLGLWQHLPNSSVSRFLSIMGWDFVVLDMQHGMATYETAHQCIYSLRDCGTQPWIRTSINSPSEVQRVLDIGAQAVVVPMVNSLAEAKELVAAAKYPPLGRRSIGGDNHIHLGSDYPDHANDSTKLIVQIEHLDGVREVEEIMALPGVDGCFIGPVDLALSMNLSLDNFAEDPELQACILRTLDACLTNGKIACCNTFSLDDAKRKVGEGFQYITQMSEVDLMVQAGRRLQQELANYRDDVVDDASSHCVV